MDFKERLEKAKEIIKDIKWKPQTVKEDYAVCVPYITAVQCCKRLDEAFDGLWEDSYEEYPNRIDIRYGKDKKKYEVTVYVYKCKLQIYLQDTETGIHTLVKEGIGEGDDPKAAESDALKRAAKKFGIGYFLYEMETVFINNVVEKYGKLQPADEKGNALTFDKLTNYINNRLKLSNEVKRHENEQNTIQPEPENDKKENKKLEKVKPSLTKKSSSVSNEDKEIKKRLFKELGEEIQSNEDIDGTIISMYFDTTSRGTKYRSMVFENILGVGKSKDITIEGLKAVILNIKKSDKDTLRKLEDTTNEFLQLLKKNQINEE